MSAIPPLDRATTLACQQLNRCLVHVVFKSGYGYGNLNVISLCQAEPYVHGKLVLQLSLHLWSIKVQM